MSTADIIDFPTQPNPVVMVKPGKHGRWTPLVEVAQTAAGAARWHARHASKATSYHAVRTPIYYGRVAQHAPRGMWKVTKNSWRWFTDSDGRVALRNTLDPEGESFIAARRQHREEVKARAFVSLFGATVAAGLGTFGWTQLPEIAHSAIANYWQVGLIGSIPLGLGLLGRPAGERITNAAELPPAAQRVTDTFIVDALCATLPAVRRAVAEDPKAVRCMVGRDHVRQLWHVVAVLPRGVTADSVISNHDKFVSALDRWSSPSVLLSEHESGRTNHLVIDLLDNEPKHRAQSNWPLASANAIDIFQPFPLGEDDLANQVMLSLDEANMLIGSLPGAGKTVSLKNILAAISLDPRSEMQVFDLKGEGSLRQFEPVCTRYAHGKNDATLLAALNALEAADKECTRRYDEVISSLPFDICPESKVTSEVADNVEGLHPIFIVIDEVHRLVLHPEHGPKAVEHMAEIIKLGRAAGIKLIFATQRPSSSSLPIEVRSQFSTRLCLRVAEQPENDMILGTGAYGEGRDATKIRKEQRGTGILDDTMLRVYYLDAAQVQKVVDRALFLRGGQVEKHVTETPALPAVVVDDDGRRLLHHIMEVGPATPEQAMANRAREAAIPMAELVDLLYAHDEDAYRDINAESLKQRIEQAGVKVEKQVNRRRGTSPEGKAIYDSLYKAVQFKHIEIRLEETHQ